MKNLYYILAPLLIIICSCESFQEEEVICLPVNMTATVIQGTETTKVIADLHYVPGTGMLDHITWSNHQTHYFEYNNDESLHVVKEFKVKEKVQKESWFQYSGALVEKVNLVKRNLDYIFLEPLDSIHVGYIDFEYEGEDIIEEIHYMFSAEGKSPEAVWKVSYQYDLNGNIINSTASDPRTKTGESITMTYDASKHPFADVNYYFTGESFVNNQLSKFIENQDLDYNYELNLNAHGYPEIIYEKLGTSNTRIIRYSYQYL
jgi:hypothetical protein